LCAEGAILVNTAGASRGESQCSNQRRDRRFGRDERFRPPVFRLLTVERFFADAFERDPFDRRGDFRAELRVFEDLFLATDFAVLRGLDFLGRVLFAGLGAVLGLRIIFLTAFGKIGWPLAAALPAIAPRTPPTTAPTGPTTLPRTAPVAAPAASLEIAGSSIFSDC
jgi:hypothetical protein